MTRLVGSLAVAGGVLAALAPGLEHASRPLAVLTVGVVATAALRHGMVHEAAHAESRLKTRTVDPAPVTQVTADISADLHIHGVDKFLAGCRLLAGPVPDPGHPGAMPLALWQPPARYGRVLVLEAFNGSPSPDGRYERIAHLVEAHHTDPIAAAAASYGVPVEIYACLSTRT